MSAPGYDLAVIGAGVVGLAHAYVAATRGKSVVVVDRDVRANGASVRNFGFVTVTGQERGDGWRIARRTRDVWETACASAGIPIEHRGLLLLMREAASLPVAEAFLGTEMGEGCALLTASQVRERAGGLGGPGLLGAIYSPHELRVESRSAIPRLAAYMEAEMDVAFRRGTAVLSAAPPVLETTSGPLRAEAVAVCPGDDFASLYPERIAAYRPRRCRLSMLRLESPGVRIPCGLMSDLGLVRYLGYAALPEAAPLRRQLESSRPRALSNGVHLIVVQSADGSLVVGDSHHYDDLPDPFAPAAAEDDILEEFAGVLGVRPPAVRERWTGTYASAADRTFFIDAPARAVRLVVVTSGAGASLAFGIAERTIDQLFGDVSGGRQ